MFFRKFSFFSGNPFPRVFSVAHRKFFRLYSGISKKRKTFPETSEILPKRREEKGWVKAFLSRGEKGIRAGEKDFFRKRVLFLPLKRFMCGLVFISEGWYNNNEM